MSEKQKASNGGRTPVEARHLEAVCNKPTSDSSIADGEPVSTLKIDPEFEALIRPLTKDEFAELEASILARGCRVPLDVWGDILVDGHHRLRVCNAHGIAYQTKQIELEDRLDARIWIRKNQFGRRNTSPIERMDDVLLLKADLQLQAQIRQKAGKRLPPNLAGGDTRDQLAKEAGVSHGTLDAHEKVREQGSADLNEAYTRGEVSTAAAAALAELPEAEQAEAVALGKEAMRQRAKKARRKAERAETIKSMPWPDGQYRVIYADPPWSYSNSGFDSSAAQQYETMSTDAICALPVADLATDQSVLFMWSTVPLLPDALRVIEAWDFEYKTCLAWDKERSNPGYYSKVRHEHLLVATRGTCHPDTEELPDSILAVRRNGRHSQKPEAFRQLIDRLYPHGPRIELFARTAAEGWTAYGNEVPA